MTDPSRAPGRRQVLTMIASATAALWFPGLARASALQRHVWRGTALGAEASIVLYDHDTARADRLLRACAAMLERLEGIFSLHRADSALSRLNAGGALRRAPEELIALLGHSQALHAATRGRFDPTVQPLWSVHAAHFAAGGGPEGPPRADLEEARRLVGLEHVALDGGTVRLKRPGMALTLNGIAQGYITDLVADRLRAAGLRHVLVDLGETRTLGPRADGTPWRIGIPNPKRPFELLTALPLSGGAVATSSGLAAPFEASGRHNHLFDPRTGRSSTRYKAVTVLAPRATIADGLSTAMASMVPGEIRPALRAARASAALVWDAEGGATEIRA